jgi:hypothetical protein
MREQTTSSDVLYPRRIFGLAERTLKMMMEREINLCRIRPRIGARCNFAAHCSTHSWTVARILSTNSGFVGRSLHSDVVTRQKQMHYLYYLFV